MPVTSGPQARLMQGVAHGSIKKPGLSQSVAKEFIAATPEKKLSSLLSGPREHFKGHGSHCGKKGC